MYFQEERTKDAKKAFKDWSNEDSSRYNLISIFISRCFKNLILTFLQF